MVLPPHLLFLADADPPALVEALAECIAFVRGVYYEQTVTSGGGGHTVLARAGVGPGSHGPIQGFGTGPASTAAAAAFAAAFAQSPAMMMMARPALLRPL